MYLQRLKDLRIDNEYNQQKIADFLKITRQQYSLYETGTRSLPIDFLFDLAKFYNTSTDYILGLTNEIKPYPRLNK